MAFNSLEWRNGPGILSITQSVEENNKRSGVFLLIRFSVPYMTYLSPIRVHKNLNLYHVYLCKSYYHRIKT